MLTISDSINHLIMLIENVMSEFTKWYMYLVLTQTSLLAFSCSVYKIIIMYKDLGGRTEEKFSS